MNINLEVDEINYIINTLAEKPYRETAALIDKVRTQAIAQVQAEPVVEAGEQCPPKAEGLPRWKCHKEVWAGRILKWSSVPDDGAVGHKPEYVLSLDNGMEFFITENQFNTQFFKQGDKDLGYLVVYRDGYTSWSPTEAFESGYTRVDK